MFRSERVALLLATLDMACHQARVNTRGPYRDLQGPASCSGLLLRPPLSPVSSFLRRLQLPGPRRPSRRGPAGLAPRGLSPDAVCLWLSLPQGIRATRSLTSLIFTPGKERGLSRPPNFQQAFSSRSVPLTCITDFPSC